MGSAIWGVRKIVVKPFYLVFNPLIIRYMLVLYDNVWHDIDFIQDITDLSRDEIIQSFEVMDISEYFDQ